MNTGGEWDQREVVTWRPQGVNTGLDDSMEFQLSPPVAPSYTRHAPSPTSSSDCSQTSTNVTSHLTSVSRRYFTQQHLISFKVLHSYKKKKDSQERNGLLFIGMCGFSIRNLTYITYFYSNNCFLRLSDYFPRSKERFHKWTLKCTQKWSEW